MYNNNNDDIIQNLKKNPKIKICIKMSQKKT